MVTRGCNQGSAMRVTIGSMNGRYQRMGSAWDSHERPGASAPALSLPRQRILQVIRSAMYASKMSLFRATDEEEWAESLGETPAIGRRESQKVATLRSRG